ncbi:MAG: hypothetical protein Q7U23_17485 [Methylococcales bacterium]|nr:hypothetical protein [Methylococcales bacterium]
MTISVTISESLIQAARMQADIQHRSINEQIGYWAMLGKIAEENPHAPLKLIQDFLRNEPC